MPRAEGYFALCWRLAFSTRPTMENTIRQAKRDRMRQAQRFEQLSAALADDSPAAIQEARIVLARIATRGSAPILRQVIDGVILAWDHEQGDWDAMA